MMSQETVTWHYTWSYILMKHFIFHMTELVLAIIRLHEVSEYDVPVHTEVTLSACAGLIHGRVSQQGESASLRSGDHAVQPVLQILLCHFLSRGFRFTLHFWLGLFHNNRLIFSLFFLWILCWGDKVIFLHHVQEATLKLELAKLEDWRNLFKCIRGYFHSAMNSGRILQKIKAMLYMLMLKKCGW